MTRTDVHRPSAIITEDYEFVAFECVKIEGLGDCHIQLENRERIRNHMARTGGTYSRHAHGGNCQVCGNSNAIYCAIFHHAPSNTYVRMGSECTEKVDMQLDRAAFTRFKDGVAQWRTARAGKNKAKALVEDHGFARAWVIYDQPGVAETRYEESTLIDLISKLVKYGSLSDKQWAFIGRLLANIDTRGLRDAQRAQEAAVAKAIPEEMIGRRVKIRGEVISKKLVESPYGSYMKMLVKHQDGWKVWG